jgi:integrase
MGTSEFDPGAGDRQAWNAGRKVGAKRALKPKQIWGIRFYLDHHRRLRDRALFDVAIDSKLRGCDVVRLKIGDIVSGGQIRTRATVTQTKTGRPVQFELLSDARASLLAWLKRRGGALGDYVFPSRVDHADHLSTRQYARLVDEWVTGVGLRREDYGTHSLRRTIWEGYCHGRRAAWLQGEDYQRLLAEPLADARDRLLIAAPVAYQTL